MPSTYRDQTTKKQKKCLRFKTTTTKVTFGNGRVPWRMVTDPGGSADEMEWRRRTDKRGELNEMERERERERKREAGRKGRRIVYSNEGINK